MNTLPLFLIAAFILAITPGPAVMYICELIDFRSDMGAERMWIMVAGPYRAGTSEPTVMAANLAALNHAAYAIFRKGHAPVVGVNLAWPIIQAAGPESYDAIMMPLSLQLTERCDAVLRTGGASDGAEKEVATFVQRGLPVFRSVDEVPTIGAG